MALRMDGIKLLSSLFIFLMFMKYFMSLMEQAIYIVFFFAKDSPNFGQTRKMRLLFSNYTIFLDKRNTLLTFFLNTNFYHVLCPVCCLESFVYKENKIESFIQFSLYGLQGIFFLRKCYLFRLTLDFYILVLFCHLAWIMHVLF